MSIRQPLAGRSHNRKSRAFSIIDAELRSRVMAKIKLSEVAVQVPFGTMLIDAAHTFLEYAEVALCRVRMHITAHILSSRMFYGPCV